MVRLAHNLAATLSKAAPRRAAASAHASLHCSVCLDLSILQVDVTPFMSEEQVCCSRGSWKQLACDLVRDSCGAERRLEDAVLVLFHSIHQLT